jgi:hypothetical protein
VYWPDGEQETSLLEFWFFPPCNLVWVSHRAFIPLVVRYSEYKDLHVSEQVLCVFMVRTNT